MSRDNSYNGFTNWATWNVALWCGNDEGLYSDLVALAARAVRRGDDEDEFIRDAETYVRDVLPHGTPDMVSDEDYKTVDWYEALSEFYTTEVEQQEDDNAE